MLVQLNLTTVGYTCHRGTSCAKVELSLWKYSTCSSGHTKHCESV